MTGPWNTLLDSLHTVQRAPPREVRQDICLLAFVATTGHTGDIAPAIFIDSLAAESMDNTNLLSDTLTCSTFSYAGSVLRVHVTNARSVL